MTHNSDSPEKSAKRHKPAIIGIVVALAVAAIAFIFFSAGETADGVATTAPEEVPLTAAEGDSGDEAITIVPEAGSPVDTEQPAN